MTRAYIESLCFESRPRDNFDIEELLEADLKYSEGAIVYLRPLKEILDNPRVISCSYYSESDTIEITVDDRSTCHFIAKTWDSPRSIIHTETCTVGNDNTEVGYYAFDKSWADEFMVSDKLLIDKKLKLLNQVKYFK